MMSETVWTYKPPGDMARSLSEELGLPPDFSQILVNRGIADAESAHRFLHGTLDDLLDPFLMRGMAEAVERLERAIELKDKVIIFGDYDVDGILSVVVLTKALESFGLDVSYFIPERLKKGYGIKEEYLSVVKEQGAKLVISVDCGMRAVDFVARAREEGIDVIITDHHQPGPAIPDALAVLNPVLPSSDYPESRLAGIGVVFKLIQALFTKKEKTSLLPHYLKLVSIGTVADIAELRGENRLFVKYGLKSLENASNPGLRALLKTCGLNRREISVADVGFRIGPRINAAGRLGMTDLAVDLFFVRTEEEIGHIVKRLDTLNTERQKIEEKIYNQAMDWTKTGKLHQKYKFLILGCTEWHRGVIGIVASKLKDYFYMPVILFAYQDGKAYGSGRSISEFSLIDCLEANRHVFINYGGHTHAVGCELYHDRMGDLKSSINAYVESRISEDILKRKIPVDSLIDFSRINASFLQNFHQLSPFGVGNPKPVFLSEDVLVSAPPQKIQRKHTKCILQQKGTYFEALGWGRADWADRLHKGDRINLVYSLQFSEYLGEKKLSLNILDIKPAD